jgi:uncharacterized membrane protein
VAAIIERSQSRMAGVGGPVYLLLFPIPIVCFVGTLATDIAYVASAFLMWLHFSEWLLATGLAFGALAALVLLVEFLSSGALRTAAFGWPHLVLFYGSLAAGLLNAFVHSIDGWTAVMPAGLAFSIIGAVLALAAAGTLLLMPVAWVDHRQARS